MKRSPIHPRCIWNLPVLAAVILIALALFLGFSERLWRRWHMLHASLPELSAVTAAAERKAYPPDTPVVRVTVQNHSNMDYSYLDHLTHAEMLREGQWMYWAEMPLERQSSTLLHYGLSAGETKSYELALNDWLPTPLKPGEYRVWMAYTPTDFTLAGTPPEDPAAAGQVCAYFSVAEPI